MRLPIINLFRWTLLVGVCATLFVGAAVFAKIGPRKYGPMQTTSGSCLLCGRHIQIEKFTGSPRETIVTDTEVSAWVDRVLPAPHGHLWSFHSSSARTEWFGGTVIGCGRGEPGVNSIWLVGQRGDWVTADSLLREYVTLALDDEARAEFIADAVSTRLRD
ncbi:MAG: hypothetical protein ACKV2Q_04065 [Planctomycetaceae bacterium]